MVLSVVIYQMEATDLVPVFSQAQIGGILVALTVVIRFMYNLMN